MIIVLGMSKQGDFHWPEKPLEKMWEIDNEARILKETEMKEKFNIKLTLKICFLSYKCLVTNKYRSGIKIKVFQTIQPYLPGVFLSDHALGGST